jgi:hypothetical protein
MIRTNPNHEATKVIDNRDQTERLLRKPTEVLPLSALATPPLMANIRGRSSAAEINLNCKVTKVFYLGEASPRVLCEELGGVWLFRSIARSQFSTGGHELLDSPSKVGPPYLRRLRLGQRALLAPRRDNRCSMLGC